MKYFVDTNITGYNLLELDRVPCKGEYLELVREEDKIVSNFQVLKVYTRLLLSTNAPPIERYLIILKHRA